MSDRQTGKTTRLLESANHLAKQFERVWFICHNESFANMVRKWDTVKLADNVEVISINNPNFVSEPYIRIRGSNDPVVIDHFVFEGGFLK